ncbi:hypothetical protein [Neorhizobium sp. JUb45]|uniref:hypothetical protein n=2 Tax=unclassified Neorhizobium TaxID=2629175 RepID=UPI001042ABD7|nr:hypothetical protein [Neorhizobium sp. JUb45]
MPVLVLLLIGAAYAGWRVFLTRSVTIRLEPAGYELTYTMAWDTSMRERVTLSKVGSPFQGASSEWIELWKRPYDSGLSVYRNQDGSRYYLGTVYKLLIFEPASGSLSSHCNPDAAPARTDLGAQLEFYNSHEVRESLDPGGRDLFEYIEEDQVSGAVPDDPPESRYFTGLQYLGRFGLVRPPKSWPGSGAGRGDEIRFVPAGHAPEPQGSLVSRCG